MIHKLVLTCVTLFLVVLFINSMTFQEPRADLTYVNPSDIHTLDPARISWVQDFRVALNIWEGLTTWHPRSTEPIEGAALFPPEISPDARTYRFTLRDDARWSSGEPVTAQDFVRGWRRAMEPGSAGDYAFLFNDHIVGAAEYVRWRHDAIGRLTSLDRGGRPAEAEAFFDEHAVELEARFAQVGARAVNERTLEVTLSGPCPYFLDLVALPVFLPCHPSIELLRERHRGRPLTPAGLVVYDPQWTKPDYRRLGYPGLITNGPYQLRDWKFKRRARLAANPHYRRADTFACRTVEMLVYDNLNAALMAYEAGYVDFLPELSVPYDHELARLSATGLRRDIHQCPVLATYFLNFNCVSETVNGRPNPFVDPRVRRAFSLGLDRETLVKRVRARGDRVARSFVPPETISGYAPPAGLLCDPGEARRLLSEAGFPGGRGLPNIIVLSTQSDERMCQAVARMWENELGVKVELQTKETKTFAEDKARRRFFVARGNWYADYNDPTTFLDCLATGNGNNDSGYSNPEYDDLLRRAEEAADAASRAAVLARAEALIVERDCPILPILHYTEPIAIQPYVTGLSPNARLWFPFRYARIER